LKQSRQNDETTRRRKPPQRRGKPLEGLQQDVGHHEVVWGVRANPPVANPVRSDHADERSNPIRTRVLCCNRHRLPINVAREDRPAASLGGSDGKHAAAGPDVENTARPARFEQTIEGEQTSARRAVMAGAERQRRFDFDANAVGGDTRAIVTPVHDEPAGRYRLKSLKTGGDPICFRDFLESKRLRNGSARCGRDHLPEFMLVERARRVERDNPAAVRLVYGARRFAGIKAFSKQIGEASCRAFVAA